jgi:hypothetical protein
MRMAKKFSVSKAKKKKKYSSGDIKKIVDAAEMDFWARVAELVPEASTGELDPGMVGKWNSMNIKAVTSWIAWNMPGGE